ncbi:MAG: ferritin family protein [Candidatus Cloacimonetes bacterium]|nr:ferritin family protein [Candidatus Cloacimonadota bacterium]
MNGFSTNEVIELAVQIEKSGYAFYQKALQRKDLDEKSKKLLLTLRDDEINHEQIFKDLRNECEIESLFAAGDWQMVGSYLKAISDAHIFSDPDASIRLAVQAKDFREIIINAISFEKDTLLYFYSLERFVADSKAKKIVKRIIDEEVTHVMKLRKLLEESEN